MTKIALIAAVAALGIAMPAAAMAQSTYTTGSAASRLAAGYPSPYGSGIYAYAPGHSYDHAQVRQWRDQSGDDCR
jgi:DNA-binding transcriptional LysR family regulator